QEVCAGGRRLPAGEEGFVPGSQHAGRQLEQEGARYSVAARGRNFHPQRLLDRHGHHGHLAVRAPPGGSGRHPVPVDVPRHAGRVQRQEVSPRSAQRSVAVGRSADRAEDAAQSAQERQGVSQRISLSGAAVVMPSAMERLAEVAGVGAAELRRAAPASSNYQIELARLERDIAELQQHALLPPVDSQQAARYVHALYQRAVLTGNLDELEAAEATIDVAIEQIPHPGDFYFLKANLA